MLRRTCVLSHVKRHLDMRLRPKIVDFRGLYLRDDVNETRRVRQVPMVENHLWSWDEADSLLF